MISKDQNSALLFLEEKLRKNTLWISYADYCLNREKGLRKEAFKCINNFISETNTWSFEQKKEFVNNLFLIFESVKEADYVGFPHPLSENLVKPTLLKWCEIEKSDNNPFRWYGKYYKNESYLLKAIELNPKDDLARATLIDWWNYSLYFSLHHLPDFYIGDPNNDIERIEKIKIQISLLTQQKLKSRYTKELEEYLELITNYINWQKSGYPDFEKWCKINKKTASFGLKAYYYE